MLLGGISGAGGEADEGEKAHLQLKVVRALNSWNTEKDTSSKDFEKE